MNKRAVKCIKEKEIGSEDVIEINKFALPPNNPFITAIDNGSLIEIDAVKLLSIAHINADKVIKMLPKLKKKLFPVSNETKTPEINIKAQDVHSLEPPFSLSINTAINDVKTVSRLSSIDVFDAYERVNPFKRKKGPRIPPVSTIRKRRQPSSFNLNFSSFLFKKKAGIRKTDEAIYDMPAIKDGPNQLRRNLDKGVANEKSSEAINGKTKFI